jgi:DtxR family Mn-dependent transcriptional regulator
MKAGDGGSVAYLASKQADIVQKLMVMGVLPGATLRVIQTYPCVALQVGQTQMAIDPALAREVYVRRISDEDSGRG